MVLFLVLNTNILLAKENIADEVKIAVLNNIEYTQNENMDKAMSSLHSQSPSYMPTKNMLKNVFGNYDLKYTLESYKYIAYDGDLAYVRVKQSTTKISGPSFHNNVIDAVQAYRKENGQWKLWSQMNINIEYKD